MSARYSKPLLVALILSLLSLPVAAQINREDVPELTNIDVVEHLGDHIPLDLKFVDENGQPVILSDYFNHDKPVMLMLGYYECPMLCNLVFNGVADGVEALGWNPGDKFQIVTVSINPKDSPQLAKAKKKNYMESMGLNENDDGWHFLTGEESQSKRLADAVGFKYYYIEEKDQYAHPAVVFLLTADGKISRYLYGLEYKQNDLKLGLLEASEGKVGSTIDRIVLYCYHYDPDAGSYVVFAGNVMKLGGLIVLIFMVILIGGLWLKERHKKASHHPVSTGTTA